MKTPIAKVLCTYPDCCRIVSAGQFKSHFVAKHLIDDQVYTDETLAKYSHDANDWRISAAVLASNKRPKKSRGRPKSTSVAELQGLKETVGELQKTLAVLSEVVVASKDIQPTAAIVSDQEQSQGSDSPHDTVPRSTAPASCSPSQYAARPIGKVAPPSRLRTKRQLEVELDEEEDSESDVELSIPSMTNAKPVDGRLPAPASAKPGRVSPADRARPSKERESTAKAEVIVTLMSLDGVPDVSRKLRGSRLEANDAVRRAWMDACRAGVSCQLESDRNGCCRIVIPNADGTEDSIEARKVRWPPKFRKLFASSDEE